MIHIVTAAHNRYKITEKFVDSLCRQTYRDIHLIFVDDGSTDGTSEMVKERLPESTILYGDGNLWWAGALQKAYEWIREYAADEDGVLISNDDTEYPPDYIEKGVCLLAKYPNTMIAGCGYGMRSGKHLDGIFEHSFRDGTGRLLPADSEGNCASTRSLFLTAAIWKKTGGMHPVLLPHYFSDFEFTIRAWKKGVKIRCAAKLSYTFDEGATGNNQYGNLTARKLFGKKSGCNPIYRLSFIFLSTPLKYLPGHLWSQCQRYFRKLGVFLRILKRK